MSGRYSKLCLIIQSFYFNNILLLEYIIPIHSYTEMSRQGKKKHNRFFSLPPPPFDTGSHSVILTDLELTHLDPSDLELTEITASAFQMLKLKVCALTPDYH